MGGLPININNEDSISTGNQSVEKGDLSVAFGLDGKRDVCVEEIEESAISNSPVPPKIWKRYVDDSFCIIGKDDGSAFHDTLNSIDTNNGPTVIHLSSSKTYRLKKLDPQQPNQNRLERANFKQEISKKLPANF